MVIDLVDIAKTIGLVLGRASIKSSDRLCEDLGAESADMLNIVVTMEEKFNIRIDEADVPSIRTVSDLHEVVRRMTSLNA
jgi:acyl carrier protein